MIVTTIVSKDDGMVMIFIAVAYSRDNNKNGILSSGNDDKKIVSKDDWKFRIFINVASLRNDNSDCKEGSLDDDNHQYCILNEVL